MINFKNLFQADKSDKSGYNYRFVSFRISLIYFTISFLWILFSDEIINQLFSDKNKIRILSTYKGWIYTTVIAIMLYVLLEGVFRKVKNTELKLEESYKELSKTHEDLTESEKKLKDKYDELKTSEKRHKRAQAIAHVGDWELNIAEQTIWASEEAHKLFGLPDNKALLKMEEVKKLVHKEDQEKILIALKSLIEEKASYNKEYRIIRQNDGVERVIHSVAEIEYDDNNKPAKLVGVIEDITEDKKLRELQEKYALLSKYSKDIILFVLEDGTIIDANQMAIKAYGYTYEELISMNVSDLRYEDDSELIHRQLSMANHHGIVFETIHKRKDGSIIPVEVSSQASILNDHSLLISIVRDITVRKISEKLLKESEQSFREIAETIDEVFWVRKKGAVTYISPAYEKVWGRDPQNILNGENELLDFVHPEDREAAERNYLQNMNCHGYVKEQQYRIIRPDGKVRWIMSKCFPIIDNSGEVVRSIEISQDFTELKESEEMLKKAKNQADAANKAKSMFLANMSHEIRTPMNGMLGMIQLAEISKTREEGLECLQYAKKSADSMLRVINDILDYSKIEAGKMVLEKAKFNLSEIVNDVLVLFGVVAKEKGIELIHQMDQSVPEFLYGDAPRLRQIISNLVGNAIKFTERGAVHVEIELQESLESKPEIKFTVKDTGIGISRDKIDDLFKSFSQIDDSSTKKFGGTGLGLAISKSLVKAMGGSIGVESEEGKGSKFFFAIPLQKASEEEAIQEPYIESSTDTVNYKDIKVLVVEDETINQKIITTFLGQMGIENKLAENGLEAVEMFKAESFDIILMDLQMPKMDGITATTIIRSSKESNAETIPIVALTAYAMSSDIQKCLETGMNDFLAKPVNLKLLLVTIEKWTSANKKH